MDSFVSAIMALLTFFLSTFGLIGKKTTPELGDDPFIPVVRFTAFSDTHINEADDDKCQRIIKAMDFAYDVAESDKYYNRVDAAMFVGDITNKGTSEQFAAFEAATDEALRGDTQLLAIAALNHDGATFKQGATDYLEAITEMDSDFHVVINGYHFIGLSSCTPVIHYTESQRVWLRKQLNMAVLDDPEKPIFVCHHEHVTETVYGSSLYEAWGTPFFTDILNDYPQVVHFSGHSHYPINDPRSIWQGSFTAVGTGTLAYAEMTVDTDRHVYPVGHTDTAQGWIVEVDAENRVRLRGYDILTGEWLCEYLINDPDNRDSFAYTEKKMKAESSAPKFGDQDVLTASHSEDLYTITTPAAQSTDGKIVFIYRYYVYNEMGVLVNSGFTPYDYCHSNPQDTISIQVNAKPGYTVKVSAENAYGMKSEPLSIVLE